MSLEKVPLGLQKLEEGDHVQIADDCQGWGHIGTVLTANHPNSILVEYKDKNDATWRRWYPRWCLRKQPKVEDNDKAISTD